MVSKIAQGKRTFPLVYFNPETHPSFQDKASGSIGALGLLKHRFTDRPSMLPFPAGSERWKKEELTNAILNIRNA